MKQFHPVIQLPEFYEVFDFTEGYDPNRYRNSSFGIGKYNEKRVGMYEQEIFQANRRNIHMGIDIAAPLGTPVASFDDGDIFLFGTNSAPGDYGPTLILRYELDRKPIFALYGHLSTESLKNKKAGQKISKGERIAWIGSKEENGGWNPHLHFQLSWMEPTTFDMPGVVSELDRVRALEIYPDPRMVLGPLY